jgi:hypothetical protein
VGYVDKKFKEMDEKIKALIKKGDQGEREEARKINSTYGKENPIMFFGHYQVPSEEAGGWTPEYRLHNNIMKKYLK